MEYRTCIKIKNKYNINLEKYVDKIFSARGWHVVRNPEHFERSVFLFGDSSQWLTMASDILDCLDLPGLQTLASDISEAFRTVTCIQAFGLDDVESYCEYHLSSEHSAFEEPPYVRDGPTVLKRFIFAPYCTSGQPFTLHFINTGGISKGLEITISGDFVENDSVALEQLNLHAYDYKKKEKAELRFEAGRQKLTLEDGRKVYYYDFPDFVFPEGINPYSAALGAQVACIFQRSVFLWLIATGDQAALDTMRIAVTPKTNRKCGLEWARFEVLLL
jgi:hypothetical protein